MPNEDGISETQDYDELTPEEVEDAERPRRSLWGLVGAIAVVVAIIILLSLLRSGATAKDVGRAITGAKTVEVVDNQKALEGSIAVWIKRDANLGAVLSAAGVKAKSHVDLGEGRWVIEVAKDTEAAAIKALKRQKGVYDAGPVYGH